jgi:serine/threonine-protein kinase
MELLEGQCLRQWIHNGPLREPDAVRVAMGVLDALAEAHAAGAIHRDIKPANVFVCRNGTVKMLDFGVARAREESRLTIPGTMLGTPEYMSPEQAIGETVDARSDVYGVGVLLFEMLTGHVPYEGATRLETQRLVVQGALPARPATISAWLYAIICRAMAKQPDQRYPSANAMLQTLRAGPPVADIRFESPNPVTPPGQGGGAQDGPDHDTPTPLRRHRKPKVRKPHSVPTPRPPRSQHPSNRGHRSGSGGGNPNGLAALALLGGAILLLLGLAAAMMGPAPSPGSAPDSAARVEPSAPSPSAPVSPPASVPDTSRTDTPAGLPQRASVGTSGQEVHPAPPARSATAGVPSIPPAQTGVTKPVPARAVPSQSNHRDGRTIARSTYTAIAAKRAARKAKVHTTRRHDEPGPRITAKPRPAPKAANPARRKAMVTGEDAPPTPPKKPVPLRHPTPAQSQEFERAVRDYGTALIRYRSALDSWKARRAREASSGVSPAP